MNPTGPYDTGSAPYGGTEIGISNACVLVPSGEPFEVWYESLGEIGDVLEAANIWTVGCFLRGVDDDAIASIWGDSAVTGAVSSHKRMDVPGEYTPGESMLGRSVSLLFVPDDELSVPGFIARRAVPGTQGDEGFAFTRVDELGIAALFRCVRDDNGRTLSIGRVSDFEA